MRIPHVLMIPFPVQGHVIPLLELAAYLAEHHVNVTFVNTSIVHDRLVSGSFPHERIRFVSVPDGLDANERMVPGRLTQVLYSGMPQKVEQMIKDYSASDGERVTCVIADQGLGRIQQVAKNMGVGSVAFSPAAAALLVLGFNIPRLIQDGIIDAEGNPVKNQTVQFAPTMPNMNTSDFIWAQVKTVRVQKIIFDVMMENNETIKYTDWLICNSTYDLEPGAFTLSTNIVPVGPLLGGNEGGMSAAQFLARDSTCVPWLDNQPPCSVLYVAFGSSTIFNLDQFQELALGLELTSRPFLWVVRTDQEFPDGFLDRISSKGRIISWAPQKKILSHPATACFISHCGWNSTVESVSNGVPMLCWPYFADQFINMSYVTDIWKAGLSVERNDVGIVGREEIKKKVDQLLGSSVFKDNALHLKNSTQISAREGGDSYKNLSNFIKWIKEFPHQPSYVRSTDDMKTMTT